MITVLRPPPFATVQDLGRFGHRSSAVPPSGAMDPHALARANELVGNRPGAAAIEWGIGAGRVRLSPGLDVAIAGGDPVARCEGDELIIEGPRSGAWAYLAAAGGIDVPEVLGSRSTYFPGRFGGFEGGPLKAGDILRTCEAPRGRSRGLRLAPEPQIPSTFNIVPGPDRALLGESCWEEFVAAEWRVSRAVSRAGYRLDGPALHPDPGPEFPSSPVCPGTIQLPPGGRPIVIMPDGPTVGGYPRIAVLLNAELGRLAQRRPGEPVRFVRR